MKPRLYNVPLLPIIVVGLSSPLSAQEYLSFGIGQRSCAFWQSDTRRMNEGISYIAGLFTGMNMMGSASRSGKGMVGKGTDLDGIVAEVKKLCNEQPSTSLSNAAGEAYAMLEERQPK